MWRLVPTPQIRARTWLLSILSAVHTLFSKNLSCIACDLTIFLNVSELVEPPDQSSDEIIWTLGNVTCVHTADKQGDLYHCCPTQIMYAGTLEAAECGSAFGQCKRLRSPPPPDTGRGDGGGVSIWAVVSILGCVCLNAIMYVCCLLLVVSVNV